MCRTPRPVCWPTTATVANKPKPNEKTVSTSSYPISKKQAAAPVKERLPAFEKLKNQMDHIE